MIDSIHGIYLDGTAGQLPAAMKSLSCAQGEECLWLLDVKYPSGAPFVLTGYSLLMTVRRYANKGSSLVVKSGSVTNAGLGQGQFEFVKSDTVAAEPAQYHYDVFMTEIATQKSYRVQPDSPFTVVDTMTKL